MVSDIFQKDEEREAAFDLYSDIIVQARQPAFYADLEVKDSPEGRFDLITLHAFLILRRLKQNQARTGGFAQKLFNVMFQNMDHSLREMGVGDLSVGKKVRGLAETFYGRVGAYEEALEQGDMTALHDALARNIFDDDQTAEKHTANLVHYVNSVISKLDEQSDDRLMLGLVSFPPVINSSEAK